MSTDEAIRPEIDPDLDAAIYQALLNAVGNELAWNATDAVVRVIASHRDAKRDGAWIRPMNGLLGYDIGGLR